MGVLVWAVAAAAEAEPAPLGVALSVGVEGVVNDPFLFRNGGRVGVTVSPAAWVEVGTAVAYYPFMDVDSDWKSLSEPIFRKYGHYDHLFLIGQWQTVARVHALRARLGRDWRGGFGLSAGCTVAMTTSEYSGLDQLRVHLGPSLGAFWEAGKGPFTLRLRWEHDAYIQTADGTTLELKDNALVGLEGMWWVR